MAVSRKALAAYCHDLLDVDAIADYAPNGLQVQGKDRIQTLVTGVTASLALIEQAIAHKADAILVHHGYFWKDTSPCIVGMQHARIKQLITHDMNCFAYHLPLDVHAEFGNNAQLADVLGIKISAALSPTPKAPAYLFHGECEPTTANDFAQHITKQLGRRPLHLPGGDKPIKRLAWCTGGAQRYFDTVMDTLDIDAYLTGEVSEQNAHSATERGVHFFACGHHATERYGAKALGQHLAEHFSLTHHFIDIDNPV